MQKKSAILVLVIITALLLFSLSVYSNDKIEVPLSAIKVSKYSQLTATQLTKEKVTVERSWVKEDWLEEQKDSDQESSSGTHEDKLEPLNRDWDWNWDKQPSPRHTKQRVEDPNKYNVQGLRVNADYRVDIQGRRRSWKPNLKEGTYWVPVARAGTPDLTRNELIELRGKPEEAKRKIDVLFEALAFMNLAIKTGHGNVKKQGKNRINWQYPKPAVLAIEEGEANCAASANVINYLLEDDYGDVGFFWWHTGYDVESPGGHVVSYIKDGEKYYFFDPVSLTGERSKYPAEDGDRSRYNGDVSAPIIQSSPKKYAIYWAQRYRKDQAHFAMFSSPHNRAFAIGTDGEDKYYPESFDGANLTIWKNPDASTDLLQANYTPIPPRGYANYPPYDSYSGVTGNDSQGKPKVGELDQSFSFVAYMEGKFEGRGDWSSASTFGTSNSELTLDLRGIEFKNRSNVEIVKYEWGFGDGETATGEYVSHTYTSGFYDITLTVTDENGNTASETNRIEVRGEGQKDKEKDNNSEARTKSETVKNSDTKDWPPLEESTGISVTSNKKIVYPDENDKWMYHLYFKSTIESKIDLKKVKIKAYTYEGEYVTTRTYGKNFVKCHDTLEPFQTHGTGFGTSSKNDIYFRDHIFIGETEEGEKVKGVFRVEFSKEQKGASQESSKATPESVKDNPAIYQKDKQWMPDKYWEQKWGQQLKPEYTKNRVDNPAKYNVQGLRVNADFKVDLHGWNYKGREPNLKKGTYWVPAARAGSPKLTRSELLELKGKPEEAKEEISVLYEALAFMNLAFDNFSSGNVKKQGRERINWQYPEPAVIAIEEGEANCASSANVINYLLEGDYDDVGFFWMHTSYDIESPGGHVVSYIRDGKKYYGFDASGLIGERSTYPVEDGDSFYFHGDVSNHIIQSSPKNYAIYWYQRYREDLAFFSMFSSPHNRAFAIGTEGKNSYYPQAFDGANLTIWKNPNASTDILQADYTPIPPQEYLGYPPYKSYLGFANDEEQGKPEVKLIEVQKGSAKESSKGLEKDGLKQLDTDWDWNWDRGPAPEFRKERVDNPDKYNVQGLRVNADFRVDLQGRRNQWKPNLRKGTYWVPAASIGKPNLTRKEIRKLAGRPKKAREKIDVLFEALAFMNLAIKPGHGNVKKTGRERIRWQYPKPAVLAIKEMEANCAASANVINYLLEDDYEEVGFFWWHTDYNTEKPGGHVVSYIKESQKYYFFDPVSLTGKRSKFPVEDGDRHYNGDISAQVIQSDPVNYAIYWSQLKRDHAIFAMFSSPSHRHFAIGSDGKNLYYPHTFDGANLTIWKDSSDSEELLQADYSPTPPSEYADYPPYNNYSKETCGYGQGKPDFRTMPSDG